MNVRPPAVAGLFYPDRCSALSDLVDRLLAEGETPGLAGDPACMFSAESPPVALVVPHAGYPYSGPIAASGYRLLLGDHRHRRVALLGPSHRIGFEGIALSSANAFTTPLGEVTVDDGLQELAIALEAVQVLDDAHAMEHSLEVHLPFLQRVLPSASALPLVVGEVDPEIVHQLLNALTSLSDTLIVVSTDLSHYLDYDSANRADARTVKKIEALQDAIHPHEACGCRALNGLMTYARTEGLHVHVLDVRNSGDTAGPQDRVVGYGAFALH